MPFKSRFPDLPLTPVTNLHHFLWNRPDQAGWPEDFTFHIDANTGQKRTYQEFRQRAKLGATALGAPVVQGGLGIGCDGEEMIGIIGQNSSDYVVLVHSLLIIATPMALIPAHSTPFELEHLLELTRPTRLFVDSLLLYQLLPVAKQLRIPFQKIYVLGKNSGEFATFQGLIETVQSRGTPVICPRPASKNTLAYLTFSSGTTGLPKAVMVSHGNVEFIFRQVQAMAPAATQLSKPKTPEGIDVHLAVLPMYHTYGLLMWCFLPFLLPSTYVIFDRWDITAALNAIPKYKISIASLVPSQVHQIVNYPELKRINFSSLHTIKCGAAYLTPSFAAKFTALMPRDLFLGEAYGLSETTGSALLRPHPSVLGEKTKWVPGAIGLLMPSMEARIVRNNGTEAGIDEVGELYLKGDTLALGYRNNEKATREAFVDGWFRTGDMFRVNEDGLFFFEDRVKDTLKVSGVQVSPLEIENILLAEPRKLIIDVCVAGVNRGRFDELVPKAWVVLSDAGRRFGVDYTVKALHEWHQSALSKHKWLRGGIEVIDKIPKSLTGKVLRRILQDQDQRRCEDKSKARL